jgi:hypothetical protein
VFERFVNVTTGITGSGLVSHPLAV